jgi:DNA invertase Pin-like site-specific DNA recombinase
MSSGAEPTRYWLLLRESSHDRLPALKSQEAALRKHVAERSGIVVGVSMDDGYSGELLDRPALNEALNAAAHKTYDVLLFDDPSRLIWGSLKHWYHLKAELGFYGVRLEALGGHYEDDGEPEVGAAVEAVVLSAPTIARRAIRRKLRQGKVHCWEEKGFVWASLANFGHTYVPGGEDVGYWELGI